MGRKLRSRGLKSRKVKDAYKPRYPPRIRILIQDLDASGIYSLRGEHFSVIGVDFEEVVEAVREALMKKYMACIGRSGQIVFIPYSPDSPAGSKCPYCGAIIGFDPHDRKCPLHKLVVARWSGKEEASEEPQTR